MFGTNMWLLKARPTTNTRHGLVTFRLDNTPNKNYGQNDGYNQKDKYVFSFRFFKSVTSFQDIVFQIWQIYSDLPDRDELSDLLSPINNEDDQQAHHCEEDGLIDAVRSMVVVNQCV